MVSRITLQEVDQTNSDKDAMEINFDTPTESIKISPMQHFRKGLLFSYAGTHFAVDMGCALCASLLLHRWGVSSAEFYKLIILYNLIAFGSQPLLGWLLDVSNCQHKGMIAGVLLTALGCAIAENSFMTAVLFLGAGNALFHVGAGAGVYALCEGKAAPSGMFVAPGAVGLFVGGTLGATSWVSPYYATIALCLAAWGLLNIPSIDFQLPVEQDHATRRPKVSYIGVVLLLLLLVVASRSFIGFSLPVPWKGMAGAPLVLLVMAFAGKSLGGYLADRIGWATFGSTMLLAVSMTLVFHQHSFTAACLSLFCVQATTGITLVATQSMFPNYPAFSFGLPCIALLAGGYPYLKTHPVALTDPSWTIVVGLCATAAIMVALIMYKRKELIYAST